MKEYYADELRFKSVYSQNNPPKAIKYGAYVVNLDEYKSIGTHGISLHTNGNSVTKFGSFGVEHIAEEFEKLSGTKVSWSSSGFDSVWILLLCF